MTDKILTTPATNNFFRAVLALKNPDEARRFFRDLLTPAEIAEFGRRWQAANMLDANVPYTDIVATTGLSSTTVARVSRWLRGPMGGYRLILNRLRHHREERPRH